jgi:hypothetical protein
MLVGVERYVLVQPSWTSPPAPRVVHMAPYPKLSGFSHVPLAYSHIYIAPHHIRTHTLQVVVGFLIQINQDSGGQRVVRRRAVRVEPANYLSIPAKTNQTVYATVVESDDDDHDYVNDLTGKTTKPALPAHAATKQIVYASVVESDDDSVRCAVFRQKFTLEDANSSHACSLQNEQACDQWHSSQVFTLLTG